MRSSQQVAKRAIVTSAVAFRASMEATDHPRSEGISALILPWLEQEGVADELDPLERELLATPYRKLSKSQWRDASWSGEAAAVFGWAIGLVQLLPTWDFYDYRLLIEKLGILRPSVSPLLSHAALRPIAELESFCVRVLLIQWEMRLQRVPDARLIEMRDKEIESLGLSATEDDHCYCRKIVDTLLPEQRTRAAGIYFLRSHSAKWLFDQRQQYFSS